MATAPAEFTVKVKPSKDLLRSLAFYLGQIRAERKRIEAAVKQLRRKK